MYFKVRVLSCCNKDYWYTDKIGDVILVKEPYDNSWDTKLRMATQFFGMM